MFSSNGVLKVTDFGIAKMVGAAASTTTRSGSALGTPAYMAPEQARSLPLSPATDVYAAGCVLYELLTGELPFAAAADPAAALYQTVHEPPRPLRDLMPHVSDGLAETTMRALRKDPAERPASAEAFAVEIAAAATSIWGPDWNGRTGIGLPGAGHILAAASRKVETGSRTTSLSKQTIKPKDPQLWRTSSVNALLAREGAVAVAGPPAVRPRRPP